MINGLITIGGTMLGIILGFILGRCSKPDVVTTIESKPKEMLPGFFESKRFVDKIKSKVSIPKRVLIDNEQQVVSEVNEGLLNELRKNILQYAKYSNYDDARTNNAIIEAELTVVKNDIGGN